MKFALSMEGERYWFIVSLTALLLGSHSVRLLSLLGLRRRTCSKPFSDALRFSSMASFDLGFLASLSIERIIQIRLAQTTKCLITGYLDHDDTH